MEPPQDEAPQCYALLVGPEESTLGFGVALAFNGRTLVNARSPFEYLSWEAFVGVPLEAEAAEAVAARVEGLGAEAADGEAAAAEADGPPAQRERSADALPWECAVCTARNRRHAPACGRCRAAPPEQLFSGDDEGPCFLAQPSKTLGVRQNSCNTECFTHFLPLYLLAERFDADFCARCLQAAWSRLPALAAPELPLDPERCTEAVWHILPALMNSTAVALVGGDLHASDVALRGYRGVHRLLLACAGPPLRERAAEEAEAFAQDPGRRLKSQCPNLGHFIPRLLLLEEPLESWAQLQESLLSETLDRTVLHAYRDFPHLAAEADEGKYAQLRWESAAKGLRMLLFSARFLQQAAQFAEHYDVRGWQADTVEREAFRESVRSIRAVDSWAVFSERWLAEAAPPRRQSAVVAAGPAGGGATAAPAKTVARANEAGEGLRCRGGAVCGAAGGGDCAGEEDGACSLASLAGRLGGSPGELAEALKGSERRSLEKGYHAAAAAVGRQAS